MAVILIDIGSGSIGAAIAHITKKSPPLLLYTTRVPIPFQEEVDGRKFERRTLETLGEVMRRLLYEGVRINTATSLEGGVEIFVSLSAPWVSSRTAILYLHAPKPVLLTPALFRALRAQDEIEGGASSVSHILQDAELIEEKLFRVTIDGYETGEPFLKPVGEATFSLLQSFAPKEFAEKIEKTIGVYFHTGNITFHAFSFAAFAGLREVFPHTRDFLFVDVSGEQTELCLIKRGIPCSYRSIPFGRNHLIRALQASQGAPRDVCESLLTLHAEGKGRGTHFERGFKALKRAAARWQELVHEALLYENPALSPVCLFADDDAASLLAEQIRQEGEVAVMNSVAVAPLLSLRSGAHPDPFLGLLSLSARALCAG